MIALLAADDLVALRLSDFDLILARQLERGLNRFGAAAGEVDRASAEGFAGEGQQFLRVVFGDGRGELAGVDEFELRRLLGHRGGNFRYAVADEVDCCGAGEIEILLAGGVPDVDAFSAHGRGEIFAEGAAEDGGPGHWGIIALRRCELFGKLLGYRVGNATLCKKRKGWATPIRLLDKFSEVAGIYSRSDIVTRRWIIEPDVRRRVQKILGKHCQTLLGGQD